MPFVVGVFQPANHRRRGANQSRQLPLRQTSLLAKIEYLPANRRVGSLLFENSQLVGLARKMPPVKDTRRIGRSFFSFAVLFESVASLPGSTTRKSPRSHAPRGNALVPTLCVARPGGERRKDSGSHAERGNQNPVMVLQTLLFRHFRPRRTCESRDRPRIEPFDEWPIRFLVTAPKDAIRPAQGNALGTESTTVACRPNGPTIRRTVGPLGRQPHSPRHRSPGRCPGLGERRDLRPLDPQQDSCSRPIVQPTEPFQKP